MTRIKSYVDHNSMRGRLRGSQQGPGVFHSHHYHYAAMLSPLMLVPLDQGGTKPAHLRSVALPLLV